MSYDYLKARGILNQNKKWSTETAGYKFWSKIKILQNIDKIDAISLVKQANYFLERKYGIETPFNWKKYRRFLVFWGTMDLH